MSQNSQSLTKTLVFAMDIESGTEELLQESMLEARKAYNKTIDLAKQGESWSEIPDIVSKDVDLVKNTTQRVVAKALDAMDNYYEYEEINKPSHVKKGSYPLRSNYQEGYTLSLNGESVQFRVSTKPYNHVKGTLKGSDEHLDLIRTALQNENWSIGTSEVVYYNGTPELHVNVTHNEKSIQDKQDSEALIGLDVNEDNIALTALTEQGVQDSIIIEFPEIKFERHRYFTIRKRVQNSGKTSVFRKLGDKEKRFVRDKSHKVSRQVVEWCQQFDNPCIVLEDLKEMRDNMDYGTRMNRRLHHLPFNIIQSFVSYKAAFEGIPVVWADPAYTSQRCPMCGYTDKSNRNKKRFKCDSCSHQDHSDRNAGVNIAMNGINETGVSWNVSTLNTLPVVRTRELRRLTSGRVDRPTVTLSPIQNISSESEAGSVSSQPTERSLGA